MSFDKKSFTDRVNNLSNTNPQTDEELANRFQTIFSTQPIASQNNYHIPADAYNNDIDREIEKMLEESDQEEDDIDNYIYGVLGDTPQQQKMDEFQTLFLGQQQQQPTEETDDLIRKLQDENALDRKYEHFTKSRDDDMQKRYEALRSEPVLFTSSGSSADKPRGSVPKPLQEEELHDEMDDWCCICNDDATIECEGCEDDNKYCNECFFHTHQSESAEYEATRHKSKRYQK
ncbi:hypothetical protein HPULCUR_006788 [Helicostylum pulchrum]|uniref:Uncharacterized protein n=1 Tax=Helicostylum pulchrum TaxID=562976 RepID=A0ABP9Y2X3_9FUNG